MPNNDYILRGDALKAVCENCSMQGDEGQPCTSRCEDYALVLKIPAADVVPVVRCRDCKYKPTAPEGITEGFQVEFPYEFDNPCPCQCGDGWYSQKPHDDFFCAYGKKEEGHE